MRLEGKDISRPLRRRGMSIDDLRNIRPSAQLDEDTAKPEREPSAKTTRTGDPLVYQLVLSKLREHARVNHLPMPRKDRQGLRGVLSESRRRRPQPWYQCRRRSANGCQLSGGMYSRDDRGFA